MQRLRNGGGWGPFSLTADIVGSAAERLRYGLLITSWNQRHFTTGFRLGIAKWPGSLVLLQLLL